MNYVIKDLLPFKGGKLEVQAVSIKSNNQYIDILNVYNPRGTLNKKEFLHYKSQLCNKYFIVGDFNGHNPLWEPTKNPQVNGCGKILEELLNEQLDLTLITPPDLATYVNPYNGQTSTIDLQFCSPHFTGMADILKMGDLGSDHNPILTSVAIRPDIQVREKRPKWVFDENKWGDWLDKLDEEPRPTQIPPLDEEIKEFIRPLIDAGGEIFKKSSPRVVEKYNKYWWNEDCARATALRRRARAKMIKEGTPANVLNYRKLTAAARKIHKMAKRLAWRKYVSQITPKTSSKDIWNIIRNFRGYSPRTLSPLKKNGSLTFNTEEKCNILGETFQSNMFRRTFPKYSREDISLIDSAAKGMEDEDYNNRFNMHELDEAIEALDSDKAYGFDDVHNLFLINLPKVRKMSLLGIINKLWRFSHFPEEWKLALIIPIFKEGKDPQLPESYRPISLLSCLSKLMEHMVCSRLMYVVESRHLLRDSQFGFRIRKSTVDPIVHIEHIIRKNLQLGKYTVLVFFYLKSAFDSVDHIFLIRTLAKKRGWR